VIALVEQDTCAQAEGHAMARNTMPSGLLRKLGRMMLNLQRSADAELGGWEEGEFGVDAFGWGADGGVAGVVDDVADATVA